MQDLTEADGSRLRATLDAYAPIRRRVRKQTRPCPWLKVEVETARDARRRLNVHGERRDWKYTAGSPLYRLEMPNEPKIECYRENLETADNESVLRFVKSFEPANKPVYPDFDSSLDATSLETFSRPGQSEADPHPAGRW